MSKVLFWRLKVDRSMPEVGDGLATHYGFLQSEASSAAAEIVRVLLGAGWARRSTAPQGKDYFGIGSVICNADLVRSCADS